MLHVILYESLFTSNELRFVKEARFSLKETLNFVSFGSASLFFFTRSNFQSNLKNGN